MFPVVMVVFAEYDKSKINQTMEENNGEKVG